MSDGYAGMAEAWAQGPALAYGPDGPAPHREVADSVSRVDGTRRRCGLRCRRRRPASAGRQGGGGGPRARHGRAQRGRRTCRRRGRHCPPVPVRQLRRRGGGVRGQPPARPGRGPRRAPPGRRVRAGCCWRRPSARTAPRPRRPWTWSLPATASWHRTGTPPSRSAPRPSATWPGSKVHWRTPASPTGASPRSGSTSGSSRRAWCATGSACPTSTVRRRPARRRHGPRSSRTPSRRSDAPVSGSRRS